MTTFTESPIINALKTDDSLRLSNGSRWLVWADNDMWQVWKKPQHTKGMRLVIETDDEGAAVAALVESEAAE